MQVDIESGRALDDRFIRYDAQFVSEEYEENKTSIFFISLTYYNIDYIVVISGFYDLNMLNNSELVVADCST